MGLFDKKSKKPSDLDDSTNGVIRPAVPATPPAQPFQSRPATPPATPAAPVVRAPERAPTPAPEPAPAPAPVVRAPERAPAPLEPSHPDFGINKAIELMRMLPDDNIELIVRVVKTTLESTNVKVANIIEDATRKQGAIEGRVAILKKEISGLEGEIATRRGEIAMLETDHKETSMVKERLVLAEKLSARGSGAAEPRSSSPASQPRPSAATVSAPATAEQRPSSPASQPRPATAATDDGVTRPPTSPTRTV